MLFSGDEADAQIRSVTLTEQCNDSTDLCPGAACAACAEIELWAPHDVVQLTAGEEFALSRIDTDIGNETPVGIFIAEQPTKASAAFRSRCRIRIPPSAPADAGARAALSP